MGSVCVVPSYQEHLLWNFDCFQENLKYQLQIFQKQNEHLEEENKQLKQQLLYMVGKFVLGNLSLD